MALQHPPDCVCLAAGWAYVLADLEPEVLQPFLLFVEHRLDPLLPTGAVDLRGDREGFAIW
jgi:hypothetical protein